MTNDPLIGRQFANFRIERLLGRGGMAVVYSGMDVALRRPVAIKMIDARYRDQTAYAERFVHEARAVASWRHENIIQVYYAGDQDGLYYYVMELIDGPNLATLIEQYTRAGELVPQGDVLRIGRALASALDYAHARGVIHRDVKPSNVFIERSGRVVLGDFGLALDIEMGSRGEVFGTPHYIAPEQARASNTAVPQSDFYSLGVILYEMLAGRVPFDDPSPSVVAVQHLTLPVPPPSRFNRSLDASVDAVLLKALSKEPGERYPTGAALVADLQSSLENIPPTPISSEDQTSSQLGAGSPGSIFHRAAEAPLAPTASQIPGGRSDQPKANLPKVLAGIGAAGCAALALLCLLPLMLPGFLPDRFLAALPWGRVSTEVPGGAQDTPPERTIGSEPDPAPTSTPAASRTTEPLLDDCGPAVTASADADSWIDQNSSDDNFGEDSILKVRSQGGRDNFRTLVRFALPEIPPGCGVQSAALRLYSPSWKDGRTLQTFQLTGAWSEDDVSWDNQPPTTGPEAAATSGSGYLEWDVTAQLRAMVELNANHGFLIRDAAEEDESGFEQQFHSREKGETPPILVITLAPAAQ